jgi:YVTN family beta-propeller protein
MWLRCVGCVLLLIFASLGARAQTVVATIDAGTHPQAVAVNPLTNKIYVANMNSQDITVIDGTSKMTTTLPGGSGPGAVAVNPRTNRIYVANRDSNDITLIDGATNSTTSIRVGQMPYSVAVNPVTNKIYVANYKSDNVDVIDGTTNEVHSIQVHRFPTAVAVNPATDKIYVLGSALPGGVLTVIDGVTEATKTIALGEYEPIAVAVNFTTNKIYVTDGYGFEVFVIDGAADERVDVIPLGGKDYAYAVAVNPTTNRVYVASWSGPSGVGRATVIDGARDSIIATVATGGGYPQAITTDQDWFFRGHENKIYVANTASHSITVIDGKTNSASTLGVGQGPIGLAVDPLTNRAYVANRDSNSVTVLGGPASARTQVLLTGGTNWSGQVLNTAEIWDPAAQRATQVAHMTSPRYRHTATPSAGDSRILIAGGRDASGATLKTAELYDGAKVVFTKTTDMKVARYGHTATLLPATNKVLIAGGCCKSNGEALESAELYDFETGAFRAAGSMKLARIDATATLLPDGRVLIAGGAKTPSKPGAISDSLREAEIYDPATGKFAATGELNNARQAATAARLNDGQVLIAGGWRVGDDPSRTAELYTPESGTFTLTADMSVGRRYAGSSRLADGRVLVMGGNNGAFYGQLFLPNSESWEGEIHMTEARDLPTATLLFNTATALDGQVLLAGGVIGNTGKTEGRLLELYDPQTNRVQPAEEMSTPRSWMTATSFYITAP